MTSPERVVRLPSRQQGCELFLDGFLLMYGGRAGTGTLLGREA
jgi:hypothetical protein